MSRVTKVIGVRPIRMKPLVKEMILAFANDYRYETRIFPRLTTAILIPVTAADKQSMGLVQIGETNVFQPVE